jgi:hypothetical protein
MMEAIRSSETSFLTKNTRRKIPEDGFLHRLRVFENRVLRRIFGPKRDEVTGGWRKLHNEELHNLYSSPSIIRMIKSRRMRWAGHMEKRNANRILVRKPEGKRPLRRPRQISDNSMEWYGPDGSGSGWGPVEGCCEHDN